MRPVDKKKPGDVIEYETSMGEVESQEIATFYKPYGEAKDPLVANLGAFCSYCEEYRPIGDIHIEHIIPKCKSGDKYAWDNFLLSCNICNSCKLIANADPSDTHFPHLDNTYLDFVYDESGRVRVNLDLPDDEYKKAEKLYNLVKMNRGPQCAEDASSRDFRWMNRFETWTIAKRHLELYISGKIKIQDILTFVLCRGHWSIWFTVFKGYDEVRCALIKQIPGTCASCFDENNHFEPIIRVRS